MFSVVPSTLRGRMTKRIALLAGLLILSGSSATFAASVSLAWDPSTDQTVIGYKLYYGPTTRAYTNSIDVGNSTSGTVSNLVAGATYFFAATAYDSTDMRKRLLHRSEHNDSCAEPAAHAQYSRGGND